MFEGEFTVICNISSRSKSGLKSEEWQRQRKERKREGEREKGRALMILGCWIFNTRVTCSQHSPCWHPRVSLCLAWSSTSVFFYPLFPCGHQINNLSVKGVIERPYCNAFVSHCVISPCTLLKLLISSEYALNQRSECSKLCFSRFVAVSTLQKGECIALLFSSLFLCWGIIHTESLNWRRESIPKRREDRFLRPRAKTRCTWREKRQRRGLVFPARLLSSLWRLLSSPLDEPLMRSFTGGEKKARGNGSLLGGGVDEIITQLS